MYRALFNRNLAIKGYTVIYEKTNFNSREKKIELAFLSKRFSKTEVQDINSRLGNYGLTNTALVIRQDSTDLKSDILAEISRQSQHVSEKDITIQNLRSELAGYTFNDIALMDEITALFPGLAPFSIGKQVVYAAKDSTYTENVLVYQAEKGDGCRTSVKD